MDIKFIKGSRRRLKGKKNIDPNLVERVLQRIQLALPYLEFNPWVVSSNSNEESGAFEQYGRRKVRLRISFIKTIEVFCHRKKKDVFSHEDKDFLNYLCRESKDVLENNTDTSLANFGAESVSNFIKDVFNLQEGPLPIFQFLRSISQQTYENQRIAYGIIILPDKKPSDVSSLLVSALENKRFKRLTDGYSTAFLIDSGGNLVGIEALPIVANKGFSSRRRPNWFANLAEASRKRRGIGIGLNRNGDILVAIDGKLAFSQRAGIWKRWDHAEIIKLLQSLPRFKGKPYDFTEVLTYIYQVALDLSFRRSGGLFVMLSNRNNKNKLLSNKEQIGSKSKDAIDRVLDKNLSNRKIYSQERQLTTDLASLDGAIVIDRNGSLISYGQVLRIADRGGAGEQGARTRAARAGSKYGLAIKISSDGDISFYSRGVKEFEI